MEDRGPARSFFCAAPPGLTEEGTTKTQGSARASLHPGLRYVAPSELIQSLIISFYFIQVRISTTPTIQYDGTAAPNQKITG